MSYTLDNLYSSINDIHYQVDEGRIPEEMGNRIVKACCEVFIEKVEGKPKKEKIYLATADSRNFSFQAIGKTYNEAIGTLHKVLKKHAKERNLEPKWFEEWAEIRVEEMSFGVGYRDREEL